MLYLSRSEAQTYRGKASFPSELGMTSAILAFPVVDKIKRKANTRIFTVLIKLGFSKKKKGGPLK